MPSGYTAPLYEGEDITFRDFVLRCARGMGAAMARDEPLSAPILLKREPSTYHRNELAKVRADRDALLRKDLPEIAAAGLASYEEACASHDQWLAKKAAIRSRYEAMLSQVCNWEPPTPDHAQLQIFMARQIEESIEFDCCGLDFYGAPNPEKYEAGVWRKNQIEVLDQAIAFHEEEWAKEVQRTTERNQWIADLFASLESA